MRRWRFEIWFTLSQDTKPGQTLSPESLRGSRRGETPGPKQGLSRSLERKRRGVFFRRGNVGLVRISGLGWQADRLFADTESDGMRQTGIILLMGLNADGLDEENGMICKGAIQLVEQCLTAQARARIKGEQRERLGQELIALALDAEGEGVASGRIRGHREWQHHDTAGDQALQPSGMGMRDRGIHEDGIKRPKGAGSGYKIGGVFVQDFYPGVSAQVGGSFCGQVVLNLDGQNGA